MPRSDVALDDIEAAARRLAGVAVETPLIESPALNERLGARVLLKLETLQRAGAFKFRGAYNRLAQLDAEARRRGVVAFSSGNHAQGVALAARLLQMPALVVMPTDAPEVKAAATLGYGAQVRRYDRLTESREAIAAAIAAERGATVVPAFDDPQVIAGQGTTGLELARQAEALGARLDLALAPVSGGGLIAGLSVALKAASPLTQIWGVEPAGFDDLRQSLAAGRRIAVQPPGRSLCDALESPAPGELTFPILERNLTGVLTVTDAEVAKAVRYAFASLKLVLEPSGAAALAALLEGHLPVSTKVVALVLSGGNVDADLFARILRGEV